MFKQLLDLLKGDIRQKFKVLCHILNVSFFSFLVIHKIMASLIMDRDLSLVKY